MHDYDTIYFLIAFLAAIFTGGLIWYIAKTAAAITYVTLADGRRQERRLPLLFRLLLPLTPAVKPLFKKSVFTRLQLPVFKRLAASGFDDVISPDEYLSFIFLAPAVVGPVLTIFLAAMLALSGRPFEGPVALRLIALVAAIVIWLCLYPKMWLKRAVALRHKAMVRALPFVIDLLTLSVEAGMDFMAAARNIVAKRKPDPLSEELSRTLVEIQLGSTRKDALKKMAERAGQPDIQSLVTALVQADELGVSIGAILRIQSDQIRARRFARAEKAANEAPIKMLFPLVGFIFPAVFIILLGPIIMQMLHGFF